MCSKGLALPKLLVLLLSLLASLRAEAEPARDGLLVSERVGCNSIRFEGEVQIPGDLVRDMCSYYEKENARDWAATFESRDASFRRRVDRAFYIREMEASHASFVVSAIRIRSLVKTKNDDLLIVVDFVEEPQIRTSFTGVREESESLGEQTLWRMESGRFLCRSCGFRGRYFLNRQIVYD